MKKQVKKFEVGKMYFMRSICDYDCVWMYLVVSRTAGTVVLQQVRNGEAYGDEARFRINRKRTEMLGAECVMPTGSYSMAPSLHADNELPEVVKLHSEFKVKCPDAILLFRHPESYDAYREDAEVIGDVCGVKVTELFGFEHAAFEHKYLDWYLPKLVAKGYRVAILDGK